MKRYFLYAVLISSALFSCKKDSTLIPQEPTIAQSDLKKYDIAFNVTGFNQSTAPFGMYAAIPSNKIASTSTALRDTLTKSIGILYYIITDSKGIVVNNITQLAADTAFGKIKTSLPAGTYHVSVVGGGYQTLATQYFSLTPNPDTTNQFVYQDIHRSYRFGSFSDTFMKLMDITVGNSTSSYNITLDRRVAQIKVNIEDAIPANASSITVTIIGDHYILKTDGTSEPLTQGLPTEVKTTLLTFTPPAGTRNANISTVVLNTQSAMTVQIKCVDGNNNVIATKTISNVTCQPNHTTLLTGNLFNGPSGSGIGVTYNSAWNVQTLNYTF